jgi:3-hydroxy-9,10-secoandrosta-1,3,5(10)-triene-9,17-dione monooxygenase reductase component
MNHAYPDERLPTGAMSPTDFRRAMGHFATGVAVVTATCDGKPFGMTVNSLTSVSLKPCLLLVCPKKGSATGEAIKRSERFGVSILAGRQRDLCMRFVGDNAARFEGLDEVVHEGDVPLIAGAVVSFVCRLHAVHPGGDHEIVVGEVLKGSIHEDAPLVYHRGSFNKMLERA